MNLDDYNDVKRNKVLVYGPPKCGKTALVGRLAEEFHLHWFDMEHGIKTLMNPEMLPQEFRKNVSVFNIPDNRALPIAIDVLRRLFKFGDCRFCYLHGTHLCPLCSKDSEAKWSDTINLSKFTDKDILVIDSWTQVSNSAANKVTLKAWQKDDEYKMDFDDWRMQGMYLDEVLSKIQSSNIHVCVISHDIDVEKDEKKERIVPIGGTRNFSKTMAKYFDECIYLQVLNKKHSAYSATTWDNVHLTGGRSGVKLEDSNEKNPVTLIDVFKAGSKKG
jgi:hypothetical protein